MRVVLATFILIAAGLMFGCQRSPDGIVRLTDFVPEGRSEISTPNADAFVVSFDGLGLEAAIREAIGKSTGDIVDIDLEGMAFLDARGRGISTLEGIQYCVDLEWLDLSDNEIIDINALSSLSDVRALSLRGNGHRRSSQRNHQLPHRSPPNPRVLLETLLPNEETHACGLGSSVMRPLQ